MIALEQQQNEDDRILGEIFSSLQTSLPASLSEKLLESS